MPSSGNLPVDIGGQPPEADPNSERRFGAAVTCTPTDVTPHLSPGESKATPAETPTGCAIDLGPLACAQPHDIGSEQEDAFVCASCDCSERRRQRCSQARRYRPRSGERDVQQCTPGDQSRVAWICARKALTAKPPTSRHRSRSTCRLAVRKPCGGISGGLMAWGVLLGKTPAPASRHFRAPEHHACRRCWPSWHSGSGV